MAEMSEQLRSANIGRTMERKAKENALEGKSEAETSSKKLKRKNTELSDTVRASRKDAR